MKLVSSRRDHICRRYVIKFVAVSLVTLDIFKEINILFGSETLNTRTDSVVEVDDDSIDIVIGTRKVKN